MKTTPTPLLALALIVCSVIAAMIIVPYASADSSSIPSLNASLLSYDPVPAAPGGTLNVYLQIKNSGSTASKVNVQFIDNGPFTLESESDRVRSTDFIPANENFLLKYRVRVSKDALPGTNYLKIQYSTEGSSNTQTTLLPVDIQSTIATLNIESVSLEPSTFGPGSNGVIKLTLKNLAGLKVASGNIKLDLSNVNIAPIGGTNEQEFTDFQQGDSRDFTFTLAPSPSMTPDVYKVPVIISFKDQKGTQYDKTEYIGIPVGVEPELSVYFDKASISSDSKTGSVSIKFVNKGLSQIKFLEMRVENSSDVSVTSESSTVYVGNINQDDYQTADISLKLAKDSVEVPMKITYRDSLNRQYDTTVNLPLRTTNASSGSSSHWGTIIIVLLVLGGIGYFVMRKMRKQQKK